MNLAKPTPSKRACLVSTEGRANQTQRRAIPPHPLLMLPWAAAQTLPSALMLRQGLQQSSSPPPVHAVIGVVAQPLPQFMLRRGLQHKPSPPPVYAVLGCSFRMMSAGTSSISPSFQSNRFGRGRPAVCVCVCVKVCAACISQSFQSNSACRWGGVSIQSSPLSQAPLAQHHTHTTSTTHAHQPLHGPPYTHTHRLAALSPALSARQRRSVSWPALLSSASGARTAAAWTPAHGKGGRVGFGLHQCVCEPGFEQGSAARLKPARTLNPR